MNDIRKNKLGIHVFVDSNNLNLAIKDCGWELDFARFYIYLKDKYKANKVFLFIGYVPGNEALYAFLQKVGYIIIFKPTLLYKDKDGNERLKGNVDAELVLYSMIEYQNYDKAVIVTGDGTFHCLIEYLERQGKLWFLIIPNSRKYSALLRKFRKYFVYLDNLREKLGKQKRGSDLRTKP